MLNQYISKKIAEYPAIPVPMAAKLQLDEQGRALLDSEMGIQTALYPRSLRWATVLGLCIFILQNGIVFATAWDFLAGISLPTDPVSSFVFYLSIGIANLLIITLTTGHFLQKFGQIFDSLVSFLGYK